MGRKKLLIEATSHAARSTTSGLAMLPRCCDGCPDGWVGAFSEFGTGVGVYGLFELPAILSTLSRIFLSFFLPSSFPNPVPNPPYHLIPRIYAGNTIRQKFKQASSLPQSTGPPPESTPIHNPPALDSRAASQPFSQFPPSPLLHCSRVPAAWSCRRCSDTGPCRHNPTSYVHSSRDDFKVRSFSRSWRWSKIEFTSLSTHLASFEYHSGS